MDRNCMIITRDRINVVKVVSELSFTKAADHRSLYKLLLHANDVVMLFPEYPGYVLVCKVFESEEDADQPCNLLASKLLGSSGEGLCGDVVVMKEFGQFFTEEEADKFVRNIAETQENCTILKIQLDHEEEI